MRAKLASDDVRQLLRLAGECKEMRHADQDASIHLLSGLARLTRSQVAIRFDASMATDAPPVVERVQDLGWASDSDRDRVYAFVCNTRIDSDPLNVAALSGAERIVTKTRADVLSPATWARTETRNEVHRPSRIDDSLMSIERFRGVRARALVFKRAWGDPPYGPEDRELVHLAHTECAWALESVAVATAPAGNWSPRERDTLEILLTGASEKTAAARLGLSRHTVHDYVKAIYKRLGVTSRAELMARAVAGRLRRNSPP